MDKVQKLKAEQKALKKSVSSKELLRQQQKALRLGLLNKERKRKKVNLPSYINKKKKRKYLKSGRIENITPREKTTPYVKETPKLMLSDLY